MANANAIVLRPPTFPDDPEWRGAKLAKYFGHSAEQAAVFKLRELRAGKSVDGTPLRPVKRSSRPDGATGPPLSPHRPESRSQKWLRSVVGLKGGTVTLYWSHGWGEILGYHARELRIKRDVIGLTDAHQRQWAAECRRYWRLIRGPSGMPGPAHLERSPGPPSAPRPGRAVPVAAEGANHAGPDRVRERVQARRLPGVRPR